MAHLIKNRSVTNDSWQLLRFAGDGSEPAIPASGDVIVPCRQWLAHRQSLLARPSRLGVWLAGDDDPVTIADDLRLFALVAVDFAKFNDGRGYSIGRLLRERYAWRGELRAVGDVHRDQLFYLARCGFDAFALPEEENPEEALSAFADFTEAYQTSVDRPVPLFRRRGTEYHGGQHASSR
ncbi:MAG TPA: DUF934 domain-containing protein [Burkholderiales bacterium]|nr:DUF934 domain-containing protein [Burkholderiales bacterium]